MNTLRSKIYVVRQLRLQSTQISAVAFPNFPNSDECAWKNAIPYKEMPGPKALPVIGYTWKFIPFIGGFKTEQVDKMSMRLFKKYGSVVKVEGFLGRPDMVLLFDPNEIKKVFRQEDVLPERPSMPSLNYYKHVHKKDFFASNGGIIAIHGEKWQKFRTKVNQIMLPPRAAKMYVKPIEYTAEAFVERIRKIKDKNDEMPADFLNEIHKWSLESIARIALDVRLGCLDNHAHPDTQRLIDAVNTFFVNLPKLELKFPFWKWFNTPTFKKYISALDTINEITVKHVTNALQDLKREKKDEECSILQKLLKMENDTKMACILALDMFLVGIDTTSNAVGSILYQLALHQDKQEMVYNEIKRILPDKSVSINKEKLEEMVYLKACIKETLRMYPVLIGNGRCTSRDCVIGGYHVPKGVQVMFEHCVISNLEEYFPRSNEFLPERWLKACPHPEYEGLNGNYHPFASLPFGYGKRMCLGRRFADLEIQTVIAKLIQVYKVEYHYNKLEYHVFPIYTPKGPLKLQFHSRM